MPGKGHMSLLDLMASNGSESTDGGEGAIVFGIVEMCTTVAIWRYLWRMIEYNSRKAGKHLGGAYSDFGKRVSSVRASVFATSPFVLGVVVLVTGVS